MAKKLTKSRDRVFLGVCGGIAEYLDWPKQQVRILWIILTLLGLGVLVYPVLAIFMPEDNSFDIENYRQ